jgi:hypothetical protein
MIEQSCRNNIRIQTNIKIYNMLNTANNLLFIKKTIKILLDILRENTEGWEAKFQKEQNYVSNTDMTEISRKLIQNCREFIHSVNG